MTGFFLGVVGVSVTTGVAAMIFMALQPLLRKRYEVKWSYYVWIILAVRLLLPVSGQTVFELVQQCGQILMSEQGDTEDVPVDIPRQQLVLTLPARLEMPVVASRQDKETVTLLTAVEYVWLAGCILVFVFSVGSYGIYYRRIMKHAHMAEDEMVQIQRQRLKSELQIQRKFSVMVYEGRISPMVIGICRPVLILPEICFSEEELYFILKHELVHLKRNDMMVKLLFVAAGAIHWFNPFVYLMRRRAEVDMELSCDRRVISGVAHDGRKAYAEALLSAVQAAYGKGEYLSTQFYGGKEIMKKRFQNIFTEAGKKNGLFLAIGTAVLTMAVGMFVGCSVADTGIKDNFSLSGTEKGTGTGNLKTAGTGGANTALQPEETEGGTEYQQQEKGDKPEAHQDTADTKAAAMEGQRKDADENIFRYDSKFLKKRIAYALEEIGVKKPYEYEVLNHNYNKKISRISYYVQIREGDSDSFDYLTITFLKGSDGWMTEDYYLEK